MNLRPFIHLILFLTFLSALPARLVNAQGFSYDGNRWYEIEVSIFSNESNGSNNELVIPDKVKLAYPNAIRQLEPAISTFMVDFEKDEPEAQFTPGRFPGFQPEPPGTEVAQTIEDTEKPEEPEMMGPPDKPRGSDFKLADFARDPFITLGSDEAEFDTYNRNIQRSPDHRLLFHAVWRQPVLSRAQAMAIFVSGGDQYGSHHELEGSMLFSFNVNRVDIEPNLWLAGFSAFPAGNNFSNNFSNDNGKPNDQGWQLPTPPFKTGDPTLTLDLPVVQLAYLDQVRQMISNELHYIDHPALGLLVEIRPYELPEPSSFSFE